MPSILFVCLGNICRSPLAEAALRAEAQRLRL
ncbi:MAG: phosphotyrosine protein phosphatase, partial [Brevundimonas sp. 32-68-21]